ncbi:MAG: D-tyrosyl-tRNA(Tyr) deacylase [Planctomycetes bacterium]|nr:D-tyrosyl-tRNA(Tyr) deacylase [Planctomycetota bacterium]
MRAVIQRVSRAEVEVAGHCVSRIDGGLLVLLCIEKGDDAVRIDRAAAKIAGLRCFADAQGRMNLDLSQIGGQVLVVPQFTLAAELQHKGRRPGFDAAAPPAQAAALCHRFSSRLAEAGLTVRTGEFGAHMAVHLTNDGPATFVYEDRG